MLACSPTKAAPFHAAAVTGRLKSRCPHTRNWAQNTHGICQRTLSTLTAAPKLSTNLSCGLVGLPNVGKSTIFNALTRMHVPAENYPFCTIDPHVGMVEVPDSRLEALAKLSESKKTVPAAMQFVDIAGLVKGASEGAGMGNEFLQNIRDVDAILHLVRCFDSPDVVRADGEIKTMVDPAGDAGVIDTELLLSDLQTTERALARLKRRSDPGLASTLEYTRDSLQSGIPIRQLKLEREAAQALRPYNFLTAKPVLYLTNIGLGDDPSPADNVHLAALHDYAANDGGGAPVAAVCAVLEEELMQMDNEAERTDFLTELGLLSDESAADGGDRDGLALGVVVRSAYKLLELQTFFTTGPQETRAWRVRVGGDAAAAASAIHTDIGNNLVKAEIVSFVELVEHGGWANAKAAGQLRTEAKDYLMQDGDVCHFLHSR